jgi:Spy/CpxP family protein refolding chaperone
LRLTQAMGKGDFYRLAATAGVAFALLAMLACPVSAQMVMGGPEEMEHEPAGPDLPMFLQSANLRPDQRAQAHQILARNHPAFAHLFDQIHTCKQQLDDQLFATGPINSAGLETLSRRSAQLQAQLADLELQTALQIRALLTPAQLKRVAEFHSKLESLHEQIHDLMEANLPPRGGGPPAAGVEAPPPFGGPPGPAGLPPHP